MYRCAKCQRVTTARSSAHSVVSDIRPREYTHRANAIPVAGGKRRKRAKRDDRGGRGWEIRSEILVCTDCLPEAQSELNAKIEALTASA
ncbi:MAG: hypothetical protein KC912_02790 [Proteobacteria bacterium]|nr:hypothetical protein [Pseudomonadota bacterium]